MKHLNYFFSIALILVSLTSFANHDKDLSDDQPMDMKQFKGLKVPKDGPNSPTGGLLNIHCKTAEGINIPSSHKDFTNCMRQKSNMMR